MKQVKVNGLVTYTGPDTDAFAQAANLARQLILRKDDITRRIAMEQAADRVEHGYANRFRTHNIDIRVVTADIVYHVPECDHELYAAGACRTPKCDNYYMRYGVRKDVAA